MDLMVAKYDYSAEGPFEISFKKGDIFVVLEKNERSGWYDGRNMATKKEGFFPSNFFEKHHPVTVSGSAPAPAYSSVKLAVSPSSPSSSAGKSGLSSSSNPSSSSSVSSTTYNNIPPFKSSTQLPPSSSPLSSSVGPSSPRQNQNHAVSSSSAVSSGTSTPSSTSPRAPTPASSFAPSQSQAANRPDIFVCIHRYEAEEGEENELTIEVGEKMIVLKTNGDWWLVRSKKGCGWVPASFLEKLEAYH